MNKKLKANLICLIVLLSISLFGCNSLSKFDVSKYVNIKEWGFNGAGILIYTVDYESNPNIESIECYTENDGHLNNGDKVEVKCSAYVSDPDNPNRHYLYEDTIKYTVNDLKDWAWANDIFDLSVTGVNTVGTFVYTPLADEDVLNDIDVTIEYKEAYRDSFKLRGDDYNGHLKNGDIVAITVKPKNKDEFETKHGFSLKEEPFEYNVVESNLCELNDSFENLPQELLDILIEISEDELRKIESNEYDYKYSKLMLHFYCLGEKEADGCSSNSLIITYQCIVHGDDFSEEDVFKNVIFNNIIKSYDDALAYLDILDENMDDLVQIEEFTDMNYLSNFMNELNKNDNLKYFYNMTW